MNKAPNYRKTILCLAKSWRPHGHCVAGKIFDNGQAGAWLRPVNAKNGNAASDADLQYQDDTSAGVLDVVSIPFIGPRPESHQTENEDLDPEYYWIKKGGATWAEVVGATDTVAGTLWSNTDSSYHGLNDKVSEAEAATFKQSLYLIKPEQIDLVVGDESLFGGGTQRRIRAYFRFNGVCYNFVVTDPWITAEYDGKEGTFRIDKCRLCVSLPEVFKGTATKLAAAVITPERVNKKA
jgi:hypothetical protein